MKDEHFAIADEVAQFVATEYVRIFWPFCDREDILQDLRLWALDHPTQVNRWCEESYDDREAGRILGRAMRNAAHRHCANEKAEQLGYRTDDLAYYSKGEIKDLLPAMFDTDAWTNPPRDITERVTRKPPAEGGGWLATLSDVSKGYDALTLDDRELLRDHYHHEESQKSIAKRLDISQPAVANRIDKAVGRLVRNLGGTRPRSTHFPDEDGWCECGWGHPGARKAITGAAARAVTSAQYDGEGS